MKFGLEQHIIEAFCEVFEANPKVDKAFMFGSRAKGNYRADSDIDIAIKGQNIILDDILKISVALEDKGIKNKFDLLDYNSINEPALVEHVDRVGIEFYSRWKECILTEMGTLKRGKSKHRPRYAFHLYGGPYPFIQTGQIREASKYITKYEQTYSEEGLAQSKLWKKGTLCITIAANIAEIAILSFDACFPDSILGFIPDKRKCNLDFTFYTLKHFQKELQQMGDGSVQDNINLGTFEQIKFPFPPLPEQTAIASILSSLDDKIDLLNRQNKTLEQLAATLFRQWFVEEAEESWETVAVGDFVKTNIKTITKGYSFQEIEYLDTSSLTEGNITETQKLSLKDAPSRAKRLVQNNDILISTVRPDQKHYGIINNPKENLVVSTGFCVITCTEINPYFIYLLLTSNEMIQYLHSIAEGSTSTYPSLKPSDIEKIKFSQPPMSRIIEFGNLAANCWTKIHNNQTQIRTLTQTRDTLLPKLMNGEVRVEI